MADTRRRLPALAVALLIVHAGCAAPSDSPVAPPEVAPEVHSLNPVAQQAHVVMGQRIQGQWVSLFEAGTDVDAFAQDNGFTVLRNVVTADGRQLVLLEGDPELIEFPAEDGVVESQANEYIALSSPVDYTLGFFQGDWGGPELLNQSGLSELGLPLSQAMSQGVGVVVAILDTGADLDHPVLAGKIKSLPGGATLPMTEDGNGVDDDGDGDIDEAYGHGTHVTGGIAMIAPGAQVTPIRVLNDDGIGTSFDLAIGMNLARAVGADIINMSLVLSAENLVIAALISDFASHGIAVVCAAGNDPAEVYFPATHPNAIGVVATQIGSVLAPFSSFGSIYDVGAPGVGLESAYPGGGSAIGSGTSFSTWVMSGLIALATPLEAQHRPIVAAKLLMDDSFHIFPLYASKYGRVSPVHPMMKMSGLNPYGGKFGTPTEVDPDGDFR